MTERKDMNETQTIAIPGSGEGESIAVARHNTKLWFGLLAVPVIGLLALFSLRTVEKMAPPLESGYAPAFQLKTFDGQTVSLAGLRGKAVAVNFWASWCQPCREEAPRLEAAWRKYKDRGFVLVGVDYLDTDPEARKYMKEFDLTYPNGPDIGTVIAQAYRITGVPETYFITRDGKLLSGKDADGKPYANFIGPISQAALEERIEKLLAQ
jgi:cytochrome c biogenesis protein CcmG/thiol:disulfide interchange protein DsbE